MLPARFIWNRFFSWHQESRLPCQKNNLELTHLLSLQTLFRADQLSETTGMNLGMLSCTTFTDKCLLMENNELKKVGSGFKKPGVCAFLSHFSSTSVSAEYALNFPTGGAIGGPLSSTWSYIVTKSVEPGNFYIPVKCCWNQPRFKNYRGQTSPQTNARCDYKKTSLHYPAYLADQGNSNILAFRQTEKTSSTERQLLKVFYKRHLNLLYWQKSSVPNISRR